MGKIIVLLLIVAATATNDVYWMDGGSMCRKDYGEEYHCIHYTNCVPLNGGLSKGYPEICRFNGARPTLCCIEKGKFDYSGEDYSFEYPGHAKPSYGYNEKPWYPGHNGKETTTFPPLIHNQKPSHPSYGVPKPSYNHDHQWSFPGHPEYNKPPNYQGQNSWDFGGNKRPVNTPPPPNQQRPSFGNPQTSTVSDTTTKTTEESNYEEENIELGNLLNLTALLLTERPSTPGPFTSAPQGPSTSDMATETPVSQPEERITNPPITLNQQGAGQDSQQDGQQTANGDGSNVLQNSDSLNIQVPFYMPSYANSTSLRICRQYYSQVPLVKGRHTPIIGGRDARPKEYPHMALLGYGDENNIQWLCGATLISDQHVLTAAHCLTARGLGAVRYVRLGELDLSNTTEESEVRDFTVVSANGHPLYNRRFSYHDIAVIRMNATVTFSAYIRPLCLATTRVLDDRILVTAGWGLTEYGGSPAAILQRTNLKHVSNERCRTIYGQPRNLPQGIQEEIQICADGGKERRDACQGDSGGPLQYTNYEYEDRDFRGFIEVAGVTSFGRGCGFTAGVYTRVLPYVRWIESIVWPN